MSWSWDTAWRLALIVGCALPVALLIECVWRLARERPPPTRRAKRRRWF